MHELAELRRKRDTYLQTAQNILNTAISEQRGLTEAENNDVQGLRQKAEAIAQTIRLAEELRELNTGTTNNNAAARALPTGSTTTETRGPFESLGEQLRTVIQAGRPGAQVDERLYQVRSISGANETIGSEGGFLLATDYSYSLLQAGMAQAKLAPRCNPFPLGPNSNSIDLPCLDETSRVNNSRFGGISLAFVAEGGDISASKPKFRKVSLKLNKLVGAAYLTDEIVQDSVILENFVRQSFANEFGFVIDNLLLRGVGAGQPLGVLSSGALVTVDKEVGQAAKTIVTENIVKMYSRNSNPEGAVWCANIDTFPSLATLTIGVGTAGSVVSVLQNGIAGSPSGMGILGRPILWMEQASSCGTVGDLLFLDMSRYLLATKGGLQTASSIHVRFLNDETCLRFTYRLDGSPDLASAITPANGSNTVSPFVALQSR